jgi:hypothetical protein
MEVKTRSGVSRSVQNRLCGAGIELKKYIDAKSFAASSIALRDELSADSRCSPRPSQTPKPKRISAIYCFTATVAEAETRLQNALKLDPESGLANAALGLVRLRQENSPTPKNISKKPSEAMPETI